MTDRCPSHLASVQRYASWIAVAGTALCALAGWWWPERFLHSYLCAFLIASGLGLGALAIAMLHQLVGGNWGRATRRILESLAWPLVWLPLLSIPLGFGVTELYPWAEPGVMETDHLLAKKEAYLNTDFFLARSLAYLLIWALMAACVSSWSRWSDRPGESGDAWYRRLRGLSALGLVVYALTVTFASVDWMMSLEPHWFSAMYGVIVIAGQGAAAFALAIAGLAWLRHNAPLDRLATPDVFQDLGNLLLASVTFWIYVAFSQFLIIWSGNLAEEVPWYLVRSQGGWQWIVLVLVLLHFVVPFAALLSRDIKRQPRYVGGVAVLVVVMHLVDVYWLTMPAWRSTLAVGPIDLLTVVTLLAVWLALSLSRLRSGSLVPRTMEERHSHEPSRSLAQPG